MHKIQKLKRIKKIKNNKPFDSCKPFWSVERVHLMYLSVPIGPAEKVRKETMARTREPNAAYIINKRNEN